MTTIQFILGFLVIMNFAAWLLFGIDKHKAENHEFRIPEAVLFLLALIGGSIGCICGMLGFHHKTRKWKFRIFMPLILALQIAFLALFCTHFNVSIR